MSIAAGVEVENLAQLCAFLIKAGQANRASGDKPALPTFGGDEPFDKSGIWSWDADSVLLAVPGCEPAFEIVSRTEWMISMAIVSGEVMIQSGVWLSTAEHMASEQRGWPSEDAAKDVDFSVAPFWVSTDCGNLDAVKDGESLKEYL